MTVMKTCLLSPMGAAFLLLASSLSAADKKSGSGWAPLFPEEGVPKGWSVRTWDDVANPAKECVWKVEKGVLNGSEPRGTWLVSDKEYGDFQLEFEWKLGPRGNSG